MSEHISNAAGIEETDAVPQDGRAIVATIAPRTCRQCGAAIAYERINSGGVPPQKVQFCSGDCCIKFHATKPKAGRMIEKNRHAPSDDEMRESDLDLADIPLGPQWLCESCGHGTFGDEPPEHCPHCRASKFLRPRLVEHGDQDSATYLAAAFSMILMQLGGVAIELKRMPRHPGRARIAQLCERMLGDVRDAQTILRLGFAPKGSCPSKSRPAADNVDRRLKQVIAQETLA